MILMRSIDMKSFLMKRFALAALVMLAAACGEGMGHLEKRVLDLATEQCLRMDAQLSASESPRTYTPQGQFVAAPLNWWCSGFYPGTLWYLYSRTGNETLRELAEKNTRKLDDVRACASGHDAGFQYWCSYGNGLKFGGHEDYLPYIEEASAYLAARFNPTVGCIRSWGGRGDTSHFLVIIDNMMNLELLMEASRLFGCDSLAIIAKTHARTTLAQHFRPDASSFHVVDYDQLTGEPVLKRTHQGYSDDSAWSRGQAWGLYGFTMMYRETGEEAFLKQAEAIARYLLGRLPADGVPFWDFDCPAIPYTEKDASAAAVMASAFCELAGLTGDRALARQCRRMAERQIRTLASPDYLCTEPGANGCFLLRHSTGNLHGDGNNKILEVDAPLSYADYYFIEAILRFNPS